MPSLATYTPYESLLFFQSVARHGADSAAFEDISATLNANEFVRDGATYDTKKFTVEALQELYEDVTAQEGNSARPGVNGHAAGHGSNPRKRKLLSPDPHSGDEHGEWDEAMAQTVMDRLYMRYKEQVTREIKEDEEEYTRLQQDVRDIRDQMQSEATGQKRDNEGSPSAGDARGELAAATFKEEKSGDAADGAEPSIASDGRPSRLPPGISSPTETQVSGQNSPRPAQAPPPPAPQVGSAASATRSPEAAANRNAQLPPMQPGDKATQHSSPSAFQNRTLPPPSPQRANYGPIAAQHGFPHGSPATPIPILNLVPGMSPMAPPADYAGQHGRPSAGQGRGSPMSYHQQPPYPGYPHYPPPPGPWPQHVPGQPHPYQAHSPFVNPHFYGPPQQGRPPPHMQTPGPHQYHQYAHPTPPTQFKGHPAWQTPVGQPWTVQASSAHSTPVGRHFDRSSNTPRSGSSTPWKMRPDTAGTLRPPSPVRPEREVSPLTDRDSPAPEPAQKEEDVPTRRKTSRSARSATKKREDDSASRRASRSARRTRAGSAASSVIEHTSRSQSIASFASDRQDRTANTKGRGRKIKNEPPHTPVPFHSDTEPQRSSGRRGHARHDTATTYPATTTAAKRKRSSMNYSSPTPSLLSPTMHRQQASNDPSLVAVSKNFAKTANLLLSEITAHKVAGIFSKALTERDAPGYKNLILRPQDLKVIKTAVTKGSKAASAAIEELENQQQSDVHGGDTPTPTKAVPGLAATGFYFVQKNEDLLPPKGIVNSAQLEMELMRIFANAVMFNPLPSKERGLGSELRLLRDGGLDTEEEAETSEESEDGEAEDGGIISQTREMCKDVIDLVTKYRDLEDDRMYGSADDAAARSAAATPAGGLRAASVSANSAFGDEGATVPEDGDGAAAGNSRKRRRIGEA